MRKPVKKNGGRTCVPVGSADTGGARGRPDGPLNAPETKERIARLVQADDLDLAVLVAGVTDDNRHEAIGTGPAVGREVW